MSFLRKIGGSSSSHNNSNHSRSSSSTSISSYSTSSPNGSSTKHSKIPIIRHSAEHYRPFAHSASHSAANGGSSHSSSPHGLFHSGSHTPTHHFTRSNSQSTHRTLGHDKNSLFVKTSPSLTPSHTLNSPTVMKSPTTKSPSLKSPTIKSPATNKSPVAKSPTSTFKPSTVAKPSPSVPKSPTTTKYPTTLKPTNNSNATHVMESDKDLLHRFHSRTSSFQETSKVNKLILSWDTADPDQWTLTRVQFWLRFHDFPDSWLQFFRKRQMEKQRFISLLAPDNFASYEKYLPSTKLGSFDRFQYLLKLTMAQNVNSTTHTRQKNNNSQKVHVRSASDSLKQKLPQPPSIEDLSNIRSVSESALNTPIQGNSPTSTRKVRSHQKAKSTDTLYRRSFISIKNASPTFGHSRGLSGIMLNLSSNENSAHSSRSGSPPMTPTSVFNRKHKSASSESSLVNAKRSSTSSTIAETENDISKVKSEFSAKNSPAVSHDSKTSRTQSIRHSPLVSEEKNSLWNKFKRRSQIGSPYTYPTRTVTASTPNSYSDSKESLPSITKSTTKQSLTQDTSISDIKNKNIFDNLQTERKPTPHLVVQTKIEPSSQSNIGKDSPKDKFVIEPLPDNPPTMAVSDLVNDSGKYSSSIKVETHIEENVRQMDNEYLPVYPKEQQVHILLTSDNISFKLLNISDIETLNQFLQKAKELLNLAGSSCEVFITDFDCQVGTALPTDLLEECIKQKFNETTKKLYFKILSPASNDLQKDMLKSGTLSHTESLSVKNEKLSSSKHNSVANSNDQASITTSMTDLNSFDDHNSDTKRYPSTPSHYYDIPQTTDNEDINYWNSKEVVMKTHSIPLHILESSSNPLPKLKTNNPSIPDSINSLNSKFGESIYQNNSDKRSDPHFIGDKLAPKREAPKPPIDTIPKREAPKPPNHPAPKRDVPKPPSHPALRRETPKPPADNLPARNMPVGKKHKSVLQRGFSTKNRTKEGSSDKLKILTSTSFSANQIAQETVISSYTPGSTNVLVPQPYKGADLNSKSSKDEEPSIMMNGAFFKNKLNSSTSTLSSIKSTASSRFDDRASEMTKARSLKNRTSRSSSIISSVSSIYQAPPLIKKTSTRRIISSSSAADVFKENDITFADAPELSDSNDSGDIIWNTKDESNDENRSDSSDDIIWSTPKSNKNDQKLENNNDDNFSSSSDDIIWVNNQETHNSSTHKKTQSHELSRLDDSIEDDSLIDTSMTSNIGTPKRKMTLRPSPEMVYQNLEKFFPQANLDDPVLEGHTPPASPRSIRSLETSKASSPLKDSSIDTPLLAVPSVEQRLNTPTKEISKSKGSRSNKLRRTKTIRTIAHEANEKRRKSVKVKRHNTKMWGTKVVEITQTKNISINKSKNSNGEYKEFAWVKGELIGKGSFGSVYLSLNITTGEMMAVKQVEVPQFGSNNEAFVSTVDALRSEVTLLKDLDHINIVQYLGFEKKNNIYSLFLEYVAGGSIGSLLRLYGRFGDKLIRHLTRQILEGLAFLHSRGILHRDMKADNILLDGDGVCKISDFGISRKSKNIYSNSDMTMRGTVFWMAPEMVDSKQGYSAKVDIWSLGCIVLEMFAGKRPWSNLEVVAAMFKIGKSKSAPPIPDDTLPLISKNGRKFLDDCFKIDPEIRPTADELLSHPFTQLDEYFDFQSTDLVKYIRNNDKINSTKLRVHSGEFSNH